MTDDIILLGVVGVMVCGLAVIAIPIAYLCNILAGGWGVIIRILREDNEKRFMKFFGDNSDLCDVLIRRKEEEIGELDSKILRRHETLDSIKDMVRDRIDKGSLSSI